MRVDWKQQEEVVGDVQFLDPVSRVSAPSLDLLM